MNHMPPPDNAADLIEALEELAVHAADEGFPMTEHLVLVAADSIRCGYGRDKIPNKSDA